MSLVETIEFDVLGDLRGGLISLEQEKNIPFIIKRVYYIFDTKVGVVRGFHAHKKLRQMAICVKGSCTIKMDDGVSVKHVTLSSPSRGLLINPMQWHEMYDFSTDCVLMVLADDFYDESDYVRRYEDFVELVKGK
ncbi:sugar 3,4-ketoisomerase [Shewanella halotolerans]|uniref:sugar 3,4-ketoisomerase n=1 Tax=Shewanella halotolerans TaxID=2864204 RepID=UPI001C65B093|nr:FdtA/QdtA family cupin domain-containing protein [Shewanella halotolerans]QYJ88707.1 FdtA/QdtA family cupin domain-containing protein [Shewanella halotolerans]